MAPVVIRCGDIRIYINEQGLANTFLTDFMLKCGPSLVATRSEVPDVQPVPHGVATPVKRLVADDDPDKESSSHTPATSPSEFLTQSEVNDESDKELIPDFHDVLNEAPAVGEPDSDKELMSDTSAVLDAAPVDEDPYQVFDDPTILNELSVDQVPDSDKMLISDTPAVLIEAPGDVSGFPANKAPGQADREVAQGKPRVKWKECQICGRRVIPTFYEGEMCTDCDDHIAEIQIQHEYHARMASCR